MTRPNYYRVKLPDGHEVECFDVIEALGFDESFNLGNVLKYLWRAGRKTPDALADLQKATTYLGREVARRGGAAAATSDPKLVAPGAQTAERLRDAEARILAAESLANDVDVAARLHGFTDDNESAPGELAQYALETLRALIVEIAERCGVPVSSAAGSLDLLSGIRFAYDRLVDLPLCRRQLPDGSVPGGTEEALEAWHRVAEEALGRVRHVEAREAEGVAVFDKLVAELRQRNAELLEANGQLADKLRAAERDREKRLAQRDDANASAMEAHGRIAELEAVVAAQSAALKETNEVVARMAASLHNLERLEGNGTIHDVEVAVAGLIEDYEAVRADEREERAADDAAPRDLEDALDAEVAVGFAEDAARRRAVVDVPLRVEWIGDIALDVGNDDRGDEHPRIVLRGPRAALKVWAAAGVAPGIYILPVIPTLVREGDDGTATARRSGPDAVPAAPAAPGGEADEGRGAAPGVVSHDGTADTGTGGPSGPFVVTRFNAKTRAREFLMRTNPLDPVDAWLWTTVVPDARRFDDAAADEHARRRKNWHAVPASSIAQLREQDAKREKQRAHDAAVAAGEEPVDQPAAAAGEAAE